MSASTGGPAGGEAEAVAHWVSMEEANEYLTTVNETAKTLAAGVALCIVAIVPLIVLGTLAEDTTSNLVSEGLANAVGLGVMFSLAAVAACLFVTAAIQWGAFARLLEEGDYSREKKRISHAPFLEAFTGVYWLLVMTGFFAYSFITEDWGQSWIIWPVAGVLFAALMVGLSYWVGSRQKNRQDV